MPGARWESVCPAIPPGSLHSLFACSRRSRWRCRFLWGSGRSRLGRRCGRDRLDRDCGRLGCGYRSRHRGVFHHRRWSCLHRRPRRRPAVDYSLLLGRNANAPLSGYVLRIPLGHCSTRSIAASHKSAPLRGARSERGIAGPRDKAWKIQVVRPYRDGHGAVLRLQFVKGQVVGVAGAYRAIRTAASRDGDQRVAGLAGAKHELRVGLVPRSVPMP